MIPYIALVTIPVIMALVTPYKMPLYAAIPAFLLYVLFIGTRFDVGPDFGDYVRLAKILVSQDYSEILFAPEPLFNVLMRYFYEQSSELLYIDLLSATIYCTGVFLVSRRLPEPWIGVLSFTSLPVPLMAMSAIRQAIAAGVILILLAVWKNVSTINKYLAIGFASLFHFSALINLLFVVTADKLSIYRQILYGILTILLLYYVVRSDQFVLYTSRYTASGAGAESSGALSHVLVNALPAAFYIAMRRRWAHHFAADRLFMTFCLASLALLPLVFISSISASRLSFYFSIVPAVVWSTAPTVFGYTEQSKVPIRFLIIAMLLGLYFSWLIYANVGWLYFPYQSFLFEHLQVHPW